MQALLIIVGCLAFTVRGDNAPVEDSSPPSEVDYAMNELDKNKDGFVEKEELAEALINAFGGSGPTGNGFNPYGGGLEDPFVAELFDKIFKIADIDGDGKLSFDELKRTFDDTDVYEELNDISEKFRDDALKRYEEQKATTSPPEVE